MLDFVIFFITSDPCGQSRTESRIEDTRSGHAGSCVRISNLTNDFFISITNHSLLYRVA